MLRQAVSRAVQQAGNASSSGGPQEGARGADPLRPTMSESATPNRAPLPPLSPGTSLLRQRSTSMPRQAPLPPEGARRSPGGSHGSSPQQRGHPTSGDVGLLERFHAARGLQGSEDGAASSLVAGSKDGRSKHMPHDSSTNGSPARSSSPPSADRGGTAVDDEPLSPSHEAAKMWGLTVKPNDELPTTGDSSPGNSAPASHGAAGDGRLPPTPPRRTSREELAALIAAQLRSGPWSAEGDSPSRLKPAPIGEGKSAKTKSEEHRKQEPGTAAPSARVGNAAVADEPSVPSSKGAGKSTSGVVEKSSASAPRLGGGSPTQKHGGLGQSHVGAPPSLLLKPVLGGAAADRASPEQMRRAAGAILSARVSVVVNKPKWGQRSNSAGMLPRLKAARPEADLAAAKAKEAATIAADLAAAAAADEVQHDLNLSNTKAHVKQLLEHQLEAFRSSSRLLSMYVNRCNSAWADSQRWSAPSVLPHQEEAEWARHSEHAGAYRDLVLRKLSAGKVWPLIPLCLTLFASLNTRYNSPRRLLCSSLPAPSRRSSSQMASRGCYGGLIHGPCWGSAAPA